MHSLLTTLLLLPALALSAPAADTCSKRSSGTTARANGPFTLMSIRSASPIHYGQVNAADQAFYINKPTAVYCPSGEVDCRGFQNTTTVIETNDLNKKSTAGFYESVPGGQQLYVARDGALRFTQAHSGDIPKGAYRRGFVHTPPSHDYNRPYGYFDFEGGSASSLFACNMGDDDQGPYKVYANVKGGKNLDRCLAFTAFALPYQGKTAWEYT